MKRNTPDELRYPVHFKGGWYYVEEKFLFVYSDSGEGEFKISRKKLERLLKIREPKKSENGG